MPAEIPEDLVIYFFPERAEKAAVSVEVRFESTLGAVLFDQEGRFVRELMTARTVQPGIYTVEWDGRTEYGLMAKPEIPFFLQISANNETIYRKAVVKQFR